MQALHVLVVLDLYVSNNPYRSGGAPSNLNSPFPLVTGIYDSCQGDNAIVNVNINVQ